MFGLLAAASLFVDFGGGIKLRDGGFQGRDPTTIICVGSETDNKKWEQGWCHLSHLRDGVPFNRRPEDTVDHWYIKRRWRVWRW